MSQQTIPKTSNFPIGKCPECNGDLFEEVEEKGDYHPDHEFIYYEKFIACSMCPFTKEYDAEDSYSADDSEIILSGN